MSQTTLTAFFNSRKRPATEDIISSKSKKLHLERSSETKSSQKTPPLILAKDSEPCVNAKISSTIQTLKTEVTSEEKYEGCKRLDSAGPSTSSNSAVVFSKKSNANNIANFEGPSKTEAVSLARKDLSLGDIRKKLASSSRLAELKASADRLSRGIQQLKESSDKRNLKQFKSIDLEVPSRSVLLGLSVLAWLCL